MCICIDGGLGYGCLVGSDVGFCLGGLVIDFVWCLLSGFVGSCFGLCCGCL